MTYSFIYRSKWFALAAIIAALFSFSVGRGEIQSSERVLGLGSPQVHQLTSRVWAVTGLFHSASSFGVNAGIIFTQNSIIFIDSGMTIASAEFLWKTATDKMRTPKDVYLILTHSHSDHVFGSRVFKEKGARVIAHERSTEHLRDDHGEYKQFIIRASKWNQQQGNEILGDVRLSSPDTLIDKDFILNIDGDEIHILSTPGHVPDELSVYHPGSKTLFAGDTIYEGSDLTTRFGGPAEWKEWIRQLNRLKKLAGLLAVVPGHGKLCGRAEIDRNIAFLEKKLKERESSRIENQGEGL